MKKPQTKRKMYQKRRKKEKEEQRKLQKQQAAMERDATLSGPYANKYRNSKANSRQQRSNKNMTNNLHYHQTHHNQCIPNCTNAYTEIMQKWWHTYNTAMQYHREQGRGWQERSTQETQEELLKRYAEEYETSSEEEDAEEEGEYQASDNEQELINHEMHQDEIDMEYIKFMEITYRHREELRLKRAAENNT